MAADSKSRFSDRVENYVKYRPSYPQAVVGTLVDICGLVPDSVLADIGSGTGLLTELLLPFGNQLYAVEPNKEMREAAEQLLGEHTNFVSVDGSAESTTLPPNSIDLLLAGQAYHWFDIAPTKIEFGRILKPNGWIALVWNERQRDTSPFLRDYENLLKTYAIDYLKVNHIDRDDDNFHAELGLKNYSIHEFENYQQFDFAGLKGRCLSSSYAPQPAHKNHAPMMTALQALFDQYEQDGTICFEYRTKVYLGQFS